MQIIFFMKETQNKNDGAEKKKGNNAKTKELPYEWKKIHDFFKWFRPETATEHFWQILKLALTNGEEETDARERSNMIFFYEQTKELLENVFVIWEKKNKKRLNEG